jgi:hypothetical protein
MGRRRSNRWSPPRAVSLPDDARGGPVVEEDPRRPVRAWLHTVDDKELRVDAYALWSTPDAVLVEWGFGQAAESAWVWRSAVKHRAELEHP